MKRLTLISCFVILAAAGQKLSTPAAAWWSHVQFLAGTIRRAARPAHPATNAPLTISRLSFAPPDCRP